MIIYGRWVSSYKNGDIVQFILRDCGKISIGKIDLGGDYFTSDKFRVKTKDGKVYKSSDILVISPFNSYYRNNQDDLYKVLLESYLGGKDV